ncbi:uncharacterized protein LOC113751212 [Coffea eugenioides]|uniref:uncharacterized protein LOC113751212 n=1 Tax=Coffea eugenioides TaxID=49369 RepID=UPI000F606894|nr:uncharacterized protein LOC113751212 [Coffea eugenioides]
MATQSNTGFHNHYYHPHHHHHHHHAQAISFESGTGLSEIITPPVPGNYYNHHHRASTSSACSRHGMLINPNIVNVSNNSLMTTAASPTAAGNIVYSGAPPPPGGAGGGGAVITSCSSGSNDNSPGNSLGSLLLDTVPGLNHEAGLAVEWSVEEQYKLEEGLVKFADEPSIMKYIKIAAVLGDKTVRDVALRCRWMMRKRRKQEDHNLGKKVKDRRDRMESCLKTTTSASPMNLAAYAVPLQPHDQSDSTSPISALIGTTRHLLEENNQALGRVSTNLASLELQDNIDLFLRIRSNLTSILNDMRNMPGIMSQMPPLPVFINEELAGSTFSSSTQCMMIGSSSGIHLKQEPGCS